MMTREASVLERSRQANILILAGTSESREVIARLKDHAHLRLTASLAGATKTPADLGVNTRTGGFGGSEGLAAFCREHEIAMLLDVTHPFAREISRNAALATAEAGIPCIRYERPEWVPEDSDRWQSFDDWQSMADAIPEGERVFLAGGTQSIEIFTRRNDIALWARALNVEGRVAPPNVTFINAMPEESVAAERETFAANQISLLCCKNSGGPASFAKIAAARELGIPVWLLARHRDEMMASATKPINEGRQTKQIFEIHNSVEAVVGAVDRLLKTASKQISKV